MRKVNIPLGMHPNQALIFVPGKSCVVPNFLKNDRDCVSVEYSMGL